MKARSRQLKKKQILKTNSKIMPAKKSLALLFPIKFHLLLAQNLYEDVYNFVPTKLDNPRNLTNYQVHPYYFNTNCNSPKKFY